MTRSQTLAAMIRDSKPLVLRFLKGFDDSNAATQAPNLPNHLVWTLGHLALTMFRNAGRIDGGQQTPGDFFLGADRGDGQRFSVKSVGFGSQPSGDASLYPPLARAVAAFETSIDRYAGVIESLGDADLERQVPWGQATISIATAAGRILFHNGTHAGQLIDLRRALGLGTVVG